MPVNKYELPGPKSLLVDLKLDRVDLVHTGSNTRADILLTKGKEQNAMPEDLLTLLGLLKPEQAEIVKSALGAKDTEISTLTTTVEELKKAAPAPTTPVQEPAKDEILKGASPEVVELINKMSGQIGELLNKEADNVAKAKFETVKAIPCDEAEMIDVLKSASPKVYDILQKAAKAIEEKVLTAKGAEGGQDPQGGDSNAAYAKLEKSANEIKAKDDSLTFEQAFVRACDADRETYAKYVKEAK